MSIFSFIAWPVSRRKYNEAVQSLADAMKENSLAIETMFDTAHKLKKAELNYQISLERILLRFVGKSFEIGGIRGRYRD